MYRTLLLFTLLITALIGCDADDTESSETATPDNYYFSSNRSGNYELYQLENGQASPLTADSRYDSWWPRQSPDGRSMLFYRSLVSDRPALGGHNNNYDHASLWKLDLSSSTETELIAVDGHGWSAQGVVDWSPAGDKLVMAAIESSTNRWHLFVTDTAGNNPVKISSRTGLYLDPSWSPDGTQIVYAAFPPEYNGIDLAQLEIYIANSDGTSERRMTNDNLRDHDPYWSPDGKTIAFESAVDPDFVGVGKWALRAVDTTDGEVRTLLDDGNINTLPRWSDDSNRILFHRFIFGSGHGFIVASMNADGSQVTPITTGGNFDDTDLDFLRPVPLANAAESAK
ncbi:MAG: hypothetical protein KTR33_09110 [Gammaproteobacteria bacterium]|nr:hypothetical protein [Gammaproteobacteria bacterium]